MPSVTPGTSTSPRRNRRQTEPAATPAPEAPAPEQTSEPRVPNGQGTALGQRSASLGQQGLGRQPEYHRRVRDNAVGGGGGRNQTDNQTNNQTGSAAGGGGGGGGRNQTAVEYHRRVRDNAVGGGGGGGGGGQRPEVNRDTGVRLQVNDPSSVRPGPGGIIPPQEPDISNILRDTEAGEQEARESDGDFTRSGRARALERVSPGASGRSINDIRNTQDFLRSDERIAGAPPTITPGDRADRDLLAERQGRLVSGTPMVGRPVPHETDENLGSRPAREPEDLLRVANEDQDNQLRFEDAQRRVRENIEGEGGGGGGGGRPSIVNPPPSPEPEEIDAGTPPAMPGAPPGETISPALLHRQAGGPPPVFGVGVTSSVPTIGAGPAFQENTGTGSEPRGRVVGPGSRTSRDIPEENFEFLDLSAPGAREAVTPPERFAPGEVLPMPQEIEQLPMPSVPEQLPPPGIAGDAEADQNQRDRDTLRSVAREAAINTANAQREAAGLPPLTPEQAEAQIRAGHIRPQDFGADVADLRPPQEEQEFRRQAEAAQEIQAGGPPPANFENNIADNAPMMLGPPDRGRGSRGAIDIPAPPAPIEEGRNQPEEVLAGRQRAMAAANRDRQASLDQMLSAQRNFMNFRNQNVRLAQQQMRGQQSVAEQMLMNERQQMRNQGTQEPPLGGIVGQAAAQAQQGQTTIPNQPRILQGRVGQVITNPDGSRTQVLRR